MGIELIRVHRALIAGNKKDSLTQLSQNIEYVCDIYYSVWVLSAQHYIFFPCKI